MTHIDRRKLISRVVIGAFILVAIVIILLSMTRVPH